jgi:serine/threonine protein kinase
MDVSLKARTLHSGRYRLLARIGEGGFGTVYKASDRDRHGKLVAIKEINMATLSTQKKIEVTDTFNREINLLSSLKHRNLPRIHDQFIDPEHWYIVMDYIEGETLEDLLARSPKGRLPLRQAVRIGITLCNVLSYLHNQSPPIIYRDVKPSNIMLTPWGHLYLIDFGIARRYRFDQVRDTGPLGSPGYAAPEQYGRAQTTPRTDIYGLGATLQTLLTGLEPLEIRTQGIPADVRIHRKLQALITQMMDPESARRPESMSKVREALIPCLDGERYGVPLLAAITQIVIYRGFIMSPFWVPYLLLVLVSTTAYCIYATIRFKRTTRTRLSIKAVIGLLGRHLWLALFPISILTGCICLLYGLLALSPRVQMAFIWTYGVFFIIIGLGCFMPRDWYDVIKRRLRSSTQPQALPPQQMQKRP